MVPLSADRPGTDPTEDLFGHASFAKALAESIRSYPGSDGLVLALYGPWGSGKSTVLNYVQHYLEQQPQGKRPVVIEFNPWWFSGQESLARAFLGQMQAVLPAKSEKFKQLGDLLGDFAEGIGSLVDLTGVTGGAGALVGKLLEQLKREPQDVPRLKEEITTILEKEGQRILVIVDDIDRLTPEETRQLFTVIKALADFPNVVYLLAFDREVVTQAIKQQSGLPGERYLEKIVQVPFEVPPVDRVALRAALFERLNRTLGDMPEGLFDQSYWTNVFHDGIDPLIQVPRDVVRLTNTLTVTYAAVRGEVNPVDFIALEAVRVFRPQLYDVIRTNPDMFRGHSNFDWHTGDQEGTRAFHQQWIGELPEPRRESTIALVNRIFPKVGQRGYGADWLPEWRRELRACHPDVFPVYFRLTVPRGTVSRQEMMTLLKLADEPTDFGGMLVEAKAERGANGLSKARALLERLMDHVGKDIPEASIPTVIQALLDVGDQLIDVADERGMFDFGNVARVARPVYHLLKRLPETERATVLGSAIDTGRAVAAQCELLHSLDKEAKKSQSANQTALLSSNEIEELKRSWLDRVRAVAEEPGFVYHPELPRLLAIWQRWGDCAEPRAWCDQITVSNEGLLSLVQSFLHHTNSQTAGDWAIRRKPRLDPRRLGDYIDTNAAAERLRELQRSDQVPDGAREAVEQYLIEFDMLRSGKDPDGDGAFDD